MSKNTPTRKNPCLTCCLRPHPGGREGTICTKCRRALPTMGQYTGGYPPARIGIGRAVCLVLFVAALAALVLLLASTGMVVPR